MTHGDQEEDWPPHGAENCEKVTKAWLLRTRWVTGAIVHGVADWIDL